MDPHCHTPGTTKAATALLDHREGLRRSLKSLHVKGRLQIFHESFGKLLNGQEQGEASAASQLASTGNSTTDLRAAVMEMRSIVEDESLTNSAAAQQKENKIHESGGAHSDAALLTLQKRNAELESVCELALKDLSRLSSAVVAELDDAKCELATKQDQLSALCQSSSSY